MKNFNFSIFKKYIKYVLVGVFSIISLIVLFFIFRTFTSKKEEAPQIYDDLTLKLRQQLDAVKEEVLIEKTKASIKTEEQKKQLEQVSAIEDGSERRKRLAELLQY